MGEDATLSRKAQNEVASYPFDWVIDLRRPNATDKRLSFPSRARWYQGVSTFFTNELFVAEDVHHRDLPAQLRALADHYERVKPPQNDANAIIVIGRRNGGAQGGIA